MNIVFLLQDTGTIYGAERATLDLARGLREAGHRAAFILLEETRLRLPASDLQDAIRDARCEMRLVPVRSRLSMDAVRSIRDALVELEAHVLHSAGYKADIHGWLATRGRGHWPHVSTVHGWLYRPDLKEQFYGWVNLIALRRATRVIALSSHYETLLRGKGITGSRLVRIPSGLDPAALRPLPEPAAGLTIGIMGRLSSEKNHGMFLSAAKQVADAGVAARFLVAGAGPERDAITRQVEALGLAGQVDLPGFMSREDFFGRVNIVVLCSTIENLPYTVLESMSLGRPVVATRVGGLPDLVEDGVTGFLVDPGDAVALGDRLVRLTREPELRRKLAEKASHKVTHEFSRDTMVARHVELYAAVTR